MDRDFLKDLLRAMRKYNPEAHRAVRACLLVKRCLESGHFHWAVKIQQKYPLPTSDDIASAYRMMLGFEEKTKKSQNGNR
jgi:hypothetical protein